jgi:hypothetical protein
VSTGCEKIGRASAEYPPNMWRTTISFSTSKRRGITGSIFQTLAPAARLTTRGFPPPAPSEGWIAYTVREGCRSAIARSR